MEERTVISYILERQGPKQGNPVIDRLQHTQTKDWEIRLSAQDFKSWTQSSNCKILYFDGASKSNPGQARARGIIVDETGDNICSYEWSLGERTNNNAEALALYQGLLQLKKLGIKRAMIFGDSAIIIRLMVHKQSSPNCNLQQILNRIKILLQNFEDIQFYHVLRTLNKQADIRANNACGRPTGALRCNAVDNLHPIP